MTLEQISEELEFRINNDAKHFGGVLPERFAIAWRAYLAGILEWGIIDVSTYRRLLTLVPDVDDDPAVAIMLGREESKEPA